MYNIELNLVFNYFILDNTVAVSVIKIDSLHTFPEIIKKTHKNAQYSSFVIVGKIKEN
jgi:hypothetical protein